MLPLDPAAVASGAFLAGLSLPAISSALGVETVNPDRPDFGLGDSAIARARLEALQAETEAQVRMRREHPGQWAVLQARRVEVERKTRERGTAVLIQEDFVDFIRHLMRRVEATFAGPIRDPIREGWHLTVFLHELIVTDLAHMMLGSADDERLKVLVPWESDQPGAFASWDRASEGLDYCVRGCKSLATWTLQGRPYCDKCALERLWKTGVMDSVHEGEYVHDPVYRSLLVKDDDGRDVPICLTGDCFRKGEMSYGFNLKHSEIAPELSCARCGEPLLERVEDY